MDNVTQNTEIENAVEVDTTEGTTNDEVTSENSEQTQVTVIPVRMEEGAEPNIATLTEMQIGTFISVMSNLYGESGEMLANGMLQNKFDSIYIPTQSELIQILNDGANHKYLAVNNRILVSITEMAASASADLKDDSAPETEEEMSESV